MSWLTRSKQKDATPEQIADRLSAIQHSLPLPSIFETQAQITATEQAARRVQQAAVMQNASYHQTNTFSYEQMILMRMNGPQAPRYLDGSSFDFLAAYRLSDEKMVVFVCNEGKYVALEDDATLFPSDSLVTQLRMIRK